MPGRCPSCNQTYTDETLSFCPNDGTPLTKDAPSSYDPQATMIAPPPPNYAPQQDYPPQQGYYAPQGGPTPPPQGGQQPPPGWQQPPPSYGQQLPPYGQQQQYAPQYGAPDAGSKSKLPLIIALAAVLLIGGGIAAYFLMRDNSSKVTTNNNTYSSSNANRTANTTTTTTTMPTMPSTTTTTSTPSTPSTASSTTTTSSGDYTEDEKHKLFQAVGITRDNALIVEVAEKIGISDSNGTPNSGFQPFIKEHFNWAVKNAAWVQEYRDPQKAREYVMEHK